jgi:hypothetical protein
MALDLIVNDSLCGIREKQKERPRFSPEALSDVTFANHAPGERLPAFAVIDGHSRLVRPWLKTISKKGQGK